MRHLPFTLLLVACGSSTPSPDAAEADAAPDTVAVADAPAPEASADAPGLDRADAVAVADAPAEVGAEVGGPDAQTDAQTDAAAVIDARPDVACPSGRAECDGDPSNGCESMPASDQLNCGACGNACQGGRYCYDGGCSCPVGQVICADRCTSLQENRANCGACGNQCPAGSNCCRGACSSRPCT